MRAPESDDLPLTDWHVRQRHSAAALRQYAELITNLQRGAQSMKALLRSHGLFNPLVMAPLAETHHLLLEVEGRLCHVGDTLHEAARQAEHAGAGKTGKPTGSGR